MNPVSSWLTLVIGGAFLILLCNMAPSAVDAIALCLFVVALSAIALISRERM